MNILFYFETKKNLRSQNLGGIEILNIDLFNKIKKVNYNTFLTNNLSHKIKNKKWDVIISSNDAKIFNQQRRRQRRLEISSSYRARILDRRSRGRRRKETVRY